jgi:hypothetical protein
LFDILKRWFEIPGGLHLYHLDFTCLLALARLDFAAEPAHIFGSEVRRRRRVCVAAPTGRAVVAFASGWRPDEAAAAPHATGANEMTMTDDETFQMGVDLAATDVLNAAKDYFAWFPELREFKVKISNDGVVILDNGRSQVCLDTEEDTA